MASSSATGPGAQRSSEPIGYLLRLSSYTEAEALLLQPLDQSVYRGVLLQVYDPSTGSHYLAYVSDIQESEPHPAPDVAALEEVLRAAEEAGTATRYEALREILRPDSPLSYTTTVTVKLALLGRLCETRGDRLTCTGLGERLDPSNVVLYDLERPPRPRSMVSHPDPDVLQTLLSRCRERGYLGVLRQMRSVSVYLDLYALNTHVAVIGQTGSGKTETVKRLVYEAAAWWWLRGTPGGPRGVIVMDLTGEYSGYPYTGATPLLRALSRLTSLGLSIPSLTVIVPYDARYTPARLVRRGLENLLRTLASYTLVRGPAAAVYLPPRRGLYAYILPRSAAQGVPGVRGQAGGWVKGDARLLYYLLARAGLLVAALPLPDSLPVDMLLEIGRFDENGDYTNLLYELLEALGVGEELPSVTLATLLAHVAAAAQDTVTLNPASLANSFCSTLSSHGLHQALRRLYLSMLNAAVASQQRGRRATPRPPRLSLRPLARFLAGSPRPGTNIAAQLRSMCSNRDARLLRRFARIAAAVEALTAPRFDRRSRLALLRRLSGTARMVNPYLDHPAATTLADRAMHGLTIVHLAPPSVGGVSSPLLPWLLYRVFRRAVQRFHPERRLLVVVEEAHNLAPSREETFAKRLLVRYAREGRKWGLGLVIVTQRPAGVDPTILSQAATLIALRLTNPDDIQAVKAGVESISTKIVESLPDLDRGEALVSGYAVPERRIPLLVKVERVS